MDQDTINVKENRYGLSNVKRERPYLSTDKERERWMEYNSAFQKILNGRVDELNGRYQQIVSILYCRKTDLYLVGVDRSHATDRTKISYFYDWLKELAEVHQIPVAERNTWEKIELVIEKCLGAEMTFEDAVAIAAHGRRAVELLEDKGVILTSSDTGQLAFKRGPKADEVIGEGTSVKDYLSEVANTTRSSRGATMRVGADIGKGKSAKVVNVWTDSKEPEVNGLKQYFIGVEEFNSNTGEKVPYDFRILAEKDTPPEVVKYVLRTLGTDKFARIVW